METTFERLVNLAASAKAANLGDDVVKGRLSEAFQKTWCGGRLWFYLNNGTLAENYSKITNLGNTISELKKNTPEKKFLYNNIQVGGKAVNIDGETLMIASQNMNVLNKVNPHYDETFHFLVEKKFGNRSHNPSMIEQARLWIDTADYRAGRKALESDPPNISFQNHVKANYDNITDRKGDIEIAKLTSKQIAESWKSFNSPPTETTPLIG